MAPSQKMKTPVALAIVALIAALLLQLYRPPLLLVGNVTVDVFEGTGRSQGGAVSYAAAVASAFGMRACIVTANAADADLSALRGHDVHVVPSAETLTFVHSYTFWGNKRKLRVPAQPNITLSIADVPWRCRNAKTILLGPLMPEDMDPSSFVRHRSGWGWRLLRLRPQVGLMAQGLQRALDATGNVIALEQPSAQLESALGGATTIFLSDVETDPWAANATGTLPRLAAATRRFVVTRGPEGADVLEGEGARRHPPFQVDAVVDTNGAGDTFATAFMLALASGHPQPAMAANWAGGMAVSQPQGCKPACVADAIAANWTSQPCAHQTRSPLLAPVVRGLAGWTWVSHALFGML